MEQAPLAVRPDRHPRLDIDRALFRRCLSLWVGSPPIHADFLGELPLQLFVVYVAAGPAVFGIAWVILRYVRQLTDAVDRLQRR